MFVYFLWKSILFDGWFVYVIEHVCFIYCYVKIKTKSYSENYLITWYTHIFHNCV